MRNVFWIYGFQSSLNPSSKNAGLIEILPKYKSDLDRDEYVTDCSRCQYELIYMSPSTLRNGLE